MEENHVTITNLQKLDDKNYKHVSHFILKISFLTLFGFWVKTTPEINPIYDL